MKTKRLTFVTLSAAALLLFSSAGWTADDDAEATIRLMTTAEADEPEAVTKQLAIPEHLLNNASDEGVKRAVENSANGLANAASRGEKKGFEHAGSRGQERSEDARENKSEMSEKTRETRENEGRADDRPEPPETPPGQG
jgi:hypothetical protein